MQKVTFLILSLALAACQVKPVPIDHLYTIDTDHGICGKYEVIDKTTLEVKTPGVDLNLADCDGFIAISKDEYKAFQTWIKDMIAKAKQKAARAKHEVESQDLKQDFEQIEGL